MNPEMLKARTKRFAIESAILCEGLPSRLSSYCVFKTAHQKLKFCWSKL